MRFCNLEVKNFMSIEEASTILNSRGLVLVQGINEDDDAFESNGAGKSTLFSESIVWCLYGKTIRGLSADGVINRKAKKGALVGMSLVDDNGDIYEVRRHRKHPEMGNHVVVYRNGINITAKSDTDTNTLIEGIIGMDYATFTNSIMFGQGLTKTFAQATDSEQKAILEQMLQIDIFKSCQEKAKEKVADLQEKLAVLIQENSKDRSAKQAWETQVADLQVKEAELGTKVQARIEELCDEKYDLEVNLSTLPLDNDLRSEVEEYTAVLAKLNKKLDSYKKLESEMATSKHTSGALARDIVDMENKKAKAIQAKMALLDGQGTCDYCGQSLTRDLVLKHIEELDSQVSDLDAKKESKENSIQDLKEFIEEAEKLLSSKASTESKKETILETLAEVRMELKALEGNRKSLQSRIDSVEKQIQEQKELRDSVYPEMIRDLVWKVGNISESIKMNEKEIVEMQSKLAKYQFWVDAYGNQGIKSVLLDGVTPFLNTRSNYYSSKLTGSSLEITFTTQEEVKSGKNKGQKKDKFSIKVDNKNGDEDYKGNSGGEKRRADICINMALQDLVLSRSSKSIDFMIYDEAFEGLDSIGCENVIHLLHEKAATCGTILVITHNPDLKTIFSKEILVRKVDGITEVLEG